MMCHSGASVSLLLSCLMVVSDAYPIKFVNKLPSESPCVWNGNQLSIFGPGSQTHVASGTEKTIDEDWDAAFCGVGIQINNWYWSESSPMYDKPKDNDHGFQNPDNSGFNVHLSPDCVASNPTNPCYGFGVRTDRVSDISYSMEGGVCTVTLEKNEWTDAVSYDGQTKCCGPPWAGAGAGACKALVAADGGFTTANGKVSWPEAWLSGAKHLKQNQFV